MKIRAHLSATITLLLLLLSIAMLPAHTASAQREPMRLICEVQQLTDNAAYDEAPRIDDGLVVWYGFDGTDAEIYLWDGVSTTQLTDNATNDFSVQIDNGMVVWRGDDGADDEIFLWDGISTTQLTNNATHDIRPEIDNGMVVWIGDYPVDNDIYLWDGISTIQLSNDPDIDGSPQIDNGMVVWESWDPVDGDYEIYLWDGTSSMALTNNTTHDTRPQIDNGMVVWRGNDGLDNEIYLWDGVSTITLTNNDIDDSEVYIKDGKVVWSGWDGFDQEIFFWDGISTMQLTNNNTDDYSPLIEGNRIIWQGTVEGKGVVYIWDGASVTLASDPNLSVTDPPDLSGTQIVAQSGDGNDDEIVFADCPTYASYPLDLAVTGDLNSTPVLPKLSWTHQPVINQVTAGPQFRVVMLNGSSVVMDRTIDATNYCVGTECVLPLAEVHPRWGLLNGDYQWWVGAIAADGTASWSGGSNFDAATFIVAVPDTALPDPITGNPADGRLGITFPDDPGTLWVQVWVGPHPNGNYFEWHERDGADNSFTCDGATCVIHPAWDVPTATSLSVWMQAWGPSGFSSGGTAASGAPSWNVNASPFDLPPDPATLPSSIDIAGTPGEPGIIWTGGAGSTWYNLIIREAGTTTEVHASWHQASAINCPGALANPADYECAALWLGLSDELTSGTDYDIFISAWGPGGFSSSSGVPGMDEYAQGGPFTYNP